MEYNEKFLHLLSDKFKNIESATTEIINLKAILELPKGTEHFMSDLHGEYDAFTHILNNASGVIKNKINITFKDILDEKSRNELATIIYYPEEKIKSLTYGLTLSKKNNWYFNTIMNVLKVLRIVATKYTKSKVRKACPTGFSYIIEELIYRDDEVAKKEEYYYVIINSIIELKRADEFIIAVSSVIKRLTVDNLHIVGDIYDRGDGPHIILDKLMEHHNVDIQWGNHDILWMGASIGCLTSIMCVLYVTSRYNNLSIIEDSYGINLRHLYSFADKTYNISNIFMPKESSTVGVRKSDVNMMCKVNKASAVLMFKLEGQLINRNKSFNMEHRLLLDKINHNDKTINIDGRIIDLLDGDFPTIDQNDPYKLTKEEEEIVKKLHCGFINSKYLQKHTEFLYNKGTLYKIINGNLLFHACIPMTKDGKFEYLELAGKKYKGKKLMDEVELSVKKAYFLPTDDKDKQYYIDLMWYWWCGAKSPMFGKDRMATFERVLVEDKEARKEPLNGYYHCVLEKGVCSNILKEFGINSDFSHIVNGHVPVKFKKGESPIKADGKLIVIDGGFSRAYQSTTGIAGYTLIYNSNEMRISSHKPFESTKKAINDNFDIYSSVDWVEPVKKRMKIKNTDTGIELLKQIEDLKLLVKKYSSGEIPQRNI